MRHPPGKDMVQRARRLRRDMTDAERLLWSRLRAGQHDRDRRKDEHRARAMAALGYRTIRFWNHDVLQNIDGVLSVIQDALPSPSHPAARGGPLPLPETGEGK
jgi:very-short-patch-repair endonuclease